MKLKPRAEQVMVITGASSGIGLATEPQRVADAILEAAVTPTRSRKVGAMSVMNTMMAKFVPGMADRMASKQVDRQHCDEPPRQPEGSLHQASEATGTAGLVHGSGGVEPR